MGKDPLARLERDHPENRGVLAYLAAGAARAAPEHAGPASVSDPRAGCGCHPDIVARLWDELGAGLPRASRALVHGTPVLLHPTAGVVLAVGLGTVYALRLPRGALTDAASGGLRATHHYRSAPVSLELAGWGPSWRLGAYLAREPQWLCAAAAELD